VAMAKTRFSIQMIDGVSDGPLAIRVVQRRRKHLSLLVEADGMVQCRAPLTCSRVKIEQFIDSHKDWLRQTLSKQANKPRHPRPQFEPGSQHYFLGQPYVLTVSDDQKCVRIENDRLCLPTKASTPERIESCLYGWYRQQAVRIAEYRLERLMFLHGLKGPRELKIRKMKARWGSCSESGVICLNLWLFAQDVRAIDYVILHELCHLKHFDHTPAFYQYLAGFMPDWRQRKARLV